MKKKVVKNNKNLSRVDLLEQWGKTASDCIKLFSNLSKEHENKIKRLRGEKWLLTKRKNVNTVNENLV